MLLTLKKNFVYIVLALITLVSFLPAAYAVQSLAFDVRVSEENPYFDLENRLYEFSYLDSYTYTSEFDLVNYQAHDLVLNIDVFDASMSSDGVLELAHSQENALTQSMQVIEEVAVNSESIQSVPFKVEVPKDLSSDTKLYSAIRLFFQSDDAEIKQSFITVLFVAFEPDPSLYVPYLAADEEANKILFRLFVVSLFAIFLIFYAWKNKKSPVMIIAILLFLLPWVIFAIKNSNSIQANFFAFTDVAQDDELETIISDEDEEALSLEEATPLEEIEILVLEEVEVLSIEEIEDSVVPDEIKIDPEEEVEEVEVVEEILIIDEEEEEEFADLEDLEISEILFDEQKIIGLELWNNDDELRHDLENFELHIGEEVIELEDYLDPDSFHYIEFSDSFEMASTGFLVSLVHIEEAEEVEDLEAPEDELTYVYSIAYDPEEFYLVQMIDVPDETEETVAEEEPVVEEEVVVEEEEPVVEEEVVVEEEESVVEEEEVVEEEPVAEEEEALESSKILQRLVEFIDEAAVQAIQEKVIQARFDKTDFVYGSFGKMTKEKAEKINQVQEIALDAQDFQTEDIFLMEDLDLIETDNISWTYLIHGTALEENGIINENPVVDFSVYSSRYVDDQLEIIFTGVSSYDPDGDELEYEWSVTGAKEWSYNGATATAIVDDAVDVYVELKVQDVFLASSSMEVKLTVATQLTVAGDSLISMNNGLEDLDEELVEALEGSVNQIGAINIDSYPIILPSYTVSALDQVIAGDMNYFTLYAGEQSFDGVTINMLPIVYDHGTVLPLENIAIYVDDVAVPFIVEEDFISFDLTSYVLDNLPSQGSFRFRPELRITVPGRTRSGVYFSHLFYTFY